MGIELTIKIVSPMDDGDHEILRGCAVMVLAIADHELAKQRFPEAFGEDDQADGETSQQPCPCGLADPNDATQIWTSKVGHRGGHRFRPVSAEAETALVN